MESHDEIKKIVGDLPDVRLVCVPSIAAKGDRVRIRISRVAPTKTSEDLVLELVSSENDNPVAVPIPIEGDEIDFEISPNLPLGQYSIQVKSNDWILDSTPLEVSEEVYARQAASFVKGLQRRVLALDEVKAGRFDNAIKLAAEAENDYQDALSPEIAARSWQDIGSVLLQSDEATKAQSAFDRAYHLYKSINDSEGQASSLFLLGQTYSRAHEVNDALTIFDRARAIADSCNADYVALRSRAALWHLSSGSEEALRRRFCRDLISFSCSAKSTRTRTEAITLYEELIPLHLLNNLWSFNNSYLLSNDMHFECTFSPRMFAPQGTIGSLSGDLKEDVITPWESVLAVFTATLLTRLIVSISEFMLEATNTHVELRVLTSRDRLVERFNLGFAKPAERDIYREAIERYFSSDDDFKYYENLARVAGASLVRRIGETDFIQMEMPLHKIPSEANLDASGKAKDLSIT